MARRRVNLQPGTTISGTTTQRVEDAARVGNAKEGVAFLNLVKAPTATGAILHIETATDPQALPDASGNNYWRTVNSISVPTVDGQTLQLDLVGLADVIRWRVGGTLSTELGFSLVVHLSDT